MTVATPIQYASFNFIADSFKGTKHSKGRGMAATIKA